jgi:ketosteroid isomerase-like protein
MRQPFFSSICLVLIAVVTSPVSADEKTNPNAKEIEKAYRDYVDAGVKKNEKALSALLAEDFTLTMETGRLLTRADTLGLLLNPDLQQEPSMLSDIKVRMYGDAAVVTARCVETGKRRGTAFKNTMQCTVTIVKKDGKWMVAAEHISLVRD